MVMARMAGLSPGTSPPPVRIAMVPLFAADMSEASSRRGAGLPPEIWRNAPLRKPFGIDTRDAVALLRGGVPRPGGTWLDLGAGRGTFTRALATLLGPAGRVYAVDRDPGAVAALRAWAARQARERAREEALVVPVESDFTGPLDIATFGG